MSTNDVDPLYELRPEERKRIDEIKENKDWVWPVPGFVDTILS
jgi:hypothetical protein